MFSGADLEQVCNEAAISAAERIERKLGIDGHIDNLQADDLVITLQD